MTLKGGTRGISFPGGSPSIRSCYLTYSDQIGRRNTCEGGACFQWVSHDPYPTVAGPQRSKFSRTLMNCVTLRTTNCSAKLFNCQTMFYTNCCHHCPPHHNNTTSATIRNHYSYLNTTHTYLIVASSLACCTKISIRPI